MSAQQMGFISRAWKRVQCENMSAGLQMTTRRCCWSVWVYSWSDPPVLSFICDPVIKLEVEKFHSTFSRDDSPLFQNTTRSCMKVQLKDESQSRLSASSVWYRPALFQRGFTKMKATLQLNPGPDSVWMTEREPQRRWDKAASVLMWFLSVSLLNVQNRNVSELQIELRGLGSGKKDFQRDRKGFNTIVIWWVHCVDLVVRAGRRRVEQTWVLQRNSTEDEPTGRQLSDMWLFRAAVFRL